VQFCSWWTVGDYGLAQEALAELHQEGVDVEGVSTVPGEATGAALIVVDAGADNQIAVGAGATQRWRPTMSGAGWRESWIEPAACRSA
jgi:sugar/nucleoside kinase (ribokinase family)